MKYLFVQEYSHYLKPSYADFEEVAPDIQLSYAAKGWYPITRSIKRGDFLKVSAERNGVLVEAQFKFDVKANIPKGENGTYEIRHGLFAGKGIFRNVASKENADFRHFFLCHSTTSNGLFLRWQIGADNYVDADAISDNI
jgi:hypothetical protein